jgi:hypothetical protein
MISVDEPKDDEPFAENKKHVQIEADERIKDKNAYWTINIP